jgi:hypothetical protein
MKTQVHVIGRRVPDVRGVRLDSAAVAANDNAAVWLEVAYEGKFRGHWMGEFEFTEETFDQIVANFHAHPQFVPGADAASTADIEAGNFDVVQWDMHHASEAPPTSGDIAVVGAPAQGWVLDVRKGRRPDGKVKLEALTRWLGQARTYVRNGQYRWASVSVVFNAKDPESGKPIGAVLTSIALTNQPFLQDLPALAASLYKNDWSPSSGPEGIIARLRAELELEKTDPDTTIVDKVNELRRWSAPGATVPDGVDIEHALQTLRCIFNLPYLTPANDVFAEVDKLFNAPAGAITAEETMTTNASNTQPAVQKSPADDLRDSLALTLSKVRKCDAKDVTNTQILMAVETGANATTELAGLFEALDVTRLADALSQIDTLKKIKVKLDELLPKYEAQQQEIARIDEQDALEDVGMALASMGFDPKDEKRANLRISLMNHRKANKEEFRKQYNTEEAKQLARARSASTVTATGGVDPTQPLVTQRTQSAGTGGYDPFAGMRVVNGQVRASQVVQDKPGTGAAAKVDLSQFPGVNEMQKALNYVRSQKGNEKLSIDDAMTQAAAVVARNRSSRAA